VSDKSIIASIYTNSSEKVCTEDTEKKERAEVTEKEDKKPLVIFSAGGKGTRIQPLNSDVPKPMIPIVGKPILQWGIENLVSQGYKEFIITVSHMASVITDYFGDGSRFGCSITYYHETEPLGNAGALFKLMGSGQIKQGSSFLYFIADAIFSIDVDRFYKYHCKNHALASLFIHPNSHPYDSSIVVTDSDGVVLQWLNKEDDRPEWYKNQVNAGLQILSTELLHFSGIKPEDVGTGEGQRKVDLDRDVLKPLIDSKRIIAYTSSEYCKDAGTPDRFHAVEEDIKCGRVEGRNLRNRQRAVFLDRDGTINKHIGFLRHPDEFELLLGVVEAIKRINESGYLAIVVTNQPVIARGEVTADRLSTIHNKMETLLGEQGAYLDAIYYCPHHPDKGFEGEIESLKIACDCRKPKPGMLLQAAKDFNIDLSASWMVGDSENDIKAGRTAGCRTALIGSEDFGQSFTVESLKDFTDHITNDNRVLYAFGNQVYTVSEVEEIYQVCKGAIINDTNNFQKLYEIFGLKPKNKFYQSRAEVTSHISECISILSRGIVGFEDEVVKCRRKFLYWNNLNPTLYLINEKLIQTPSLRKLNNNVKRNRQLTDQLIAYACYLTIIDSENTEYAVRKIKDDSLWQHKLDYRYVDSIRFFSERYQVSNDLEIDLESIFDDIYKDIVDYGAIDFYKKVYNGLCHAYDESEQRVVVNNEVNAELPTLFHLCLKAMTDSKRETVDSLKENITFESIIERTQKAIVLLDADNEHDLNLLLPPRDDGYLEDLMNYSAVYDIHQYCVEGMLFLIKRILSSFSDKIEEEYNLSADDLYKLIKKLTDSSMRDFASGNLSVIDLDMFSSKEVEVIDKMTANGSLNADYVLPLQWNKVNDDSEWIIKERDNYLLLPSMLSMLGIYDKIGAALNWQDFGSQIEQAVLDLFGSIYGLNVYSGKYLFEGEVDECDAVVIGTKYALIIESKRKGITRAARAGSKADVIKDVAESYFSSQHQAYRMIRAIVESDGIIGFYPSECDISEKAGENKQYDQYRKDVDFSKIETFIRISCTGGNFWLISEGGIADNIERKIDDFAVDDKNRKYIDKFKTEREAVCKLSGSGKKVVRLNRLFLSFDKLYDIVTRFENQGLEGDDLIESIWKLTRTQSKKVNTTDNMTFFGNLVIGNMKELHSGEQGNNRRRTGIPVSMLVLKQYYEDYLTYVFKMPMINIETLKALGVECVRENYKYYVCKKLCFEEITGDTEKRKKAHTTLGVALDTVKEEIDNGETLMSSIIKAVDEGLVREQYDDPRGLFCAEMMRRYGDYIEGSEFGRHIKIAIEFFKTAQKDGFSDVAMGNQSYTEVMNDIELMRVYVELMGKSESYSE